VALYRSRTDSYQFRRNQLLSTISSGAANAAMAQRWLAVLDSAATLGSWGKPAAGNFQGIAVDAAFNSIIAMVVELSATATSITVKKVSVALDSYLVVNPDSAIAQMQGGVVHALNATLYGRQTFVNGVAQRANFNTYSMIRSSSMPDVQVVLTQPTTLARSSVIGGVGELGVPALAPAIAHAFFKATGKRVRSLPFFG
jgi:isoquinoline 1-oxidoreductase beta subunit